MKNKYIAQLKLGAVDLVLFHLIVFSLSFQNISAKDSKIKLKIKETSETILINSKSYSLSINKLDAIAHLQNLQGKLYSYFPLDIQFNLADTKNFSTFTRQWKVHGKQITMTATEHGLVVQRTVISCFDESFEIQLSEKLLPTANTGVYLLRRGNEGFNTSNWEQYFSPEPDDFFNPHPTVDIRVDRDQQWAFSPAPLNLSFKTEAGWFSIGLAELPDASIYTFKNNAVWLDFPWMKIQPKENELYQFPTLVFTFNDSPWEAVGNFSNHLFIKYKDTPHPSEYKQRYQWWTHPLVSTWGEQKILNITGANPKFNSKWVKDYIAQQQQALDSLKFNLIIENKWARADGDPYPSDRFADLRKSIDWCHEQGLKVILFWKAWKVEANSLAIDMEVFDGEHIDATHPMFESYVDSCCQVLLGDGSDALNADGLKIDCLFLVRDPAQANYYNSSSGMGFKEIYRYLEAFYRYAKKYKEDAIIMSSAIDPHFSNIQDMVKINDDWDNKLIREKRARIITQAMPGMLLNGDASDMSIKIANYHYLTSAVYGIPSIQYLTYFHDSEITPETKHILLQLLKLYEQKPNGRLKFVDYGNWQILNKNDEVLAESVPAGKGLLIYHNKDEASFFCTENSIVHLILDRHLLITIHDENGLTVPFTDLGHGLYELNDVKQGKLYKLRLRKIWTTNF